MAPNTEVDADTVVAFKPSLAYMGLDEVRPTKVPTLVRDEARTVEPRVVLVRTLAPPIARLPAPPKYALVEDDRS